jgi:hypothetical protein
MENTILLEPKAFPVIKDLVWRQNAFDRIQQVVLSINTSGNPTDANAIPILNTMLIEPLMLVLVVEPV